MFRAMLLLAAASAAAAQVAAPTDGQVKIDCSWVSTNLVAQVLGKSFTKLASMYTCLVTNDSEEPVIVTENAVMRAVPQLRPIDRVTVQLAIQSVAKRSKLERTVRVVGDFAQFAALITVGKIVTVPYQVIEGLTAANSQVPYLISRLTGLEIPISANLQVLDPANPSPITPGDVQVVRIFGAPTKSDPGLASAVVRLSSSQKFRMLR